MPKINTKKIASLMALVILTSIGFNQSALASSAAKSTVTTTTATTNITQSVAQSYSADSSVDIGMLVELEPHSKDVVEALKQSDLTNMLGVAVEPNQTTFSLTPVSVANQQIIVANTGRYAVLVSNENGPIAVGDYITGSSLNGVGMRADSSENVVVGKALTAYSGTGNVLGTANVTNSAGKQVEISIGLVPVNLNIVHNPLASKETDYIPSFLAKTATTISNHPVSAARIYLGFAIIVLSAFVTANMLYSGIRNGMISVGRNPLSKKSILISLIQTVAGALIIFVVGIFGVYLLLKL